MFAGVESLLGIEEVMQQLGGKYKIHRLAGDASSRQYFRAKSSHSSILLCLCPESEINRKFVDVANVYSAHSILVPAIYSVLRQGHLILLEDLGDHSFLDSIKPLVQEKKQAAYMDLFKLANDVSLIKDDIFPVFDKEWIERERIMLVNGLRAAKVCTEKETVDFNDDLIKNNEKELIIKSDYVPQHRDFHGRNIQVRDNRHYIIDFQDTFLSNSYYDIVSLVYDPYSDLTLDSRESLVVEYQSIQKQFNHKQFFATARQRLWKAIGTYLNQHYVYQKSGYLNYIKSTCQILRTLKLSDLQQRITEKLEDSSFD